MDIDVKQIKIHISDTQLHSQIGGVNKFMVYTLKGSDNNGDIQINRRFSDFILLRQILIKRWPGIYIPALPQKKTIGSNQNLFIQTRKHGLDAFLMILAQDKVIWQSQQMQTFLHNKGNDSEKILNPLLKQPHSKILQRYKKIYPQFSEKIQQRQNESKLNQFNSYLNDCLNVLTKLSQSCTKMKEISKNNAQKKMSLFQFIFPDYQRACLLQNDERRKIQNLLFHNKSENGILNIQKQLKQTYKYPSLVMISTQIKRQQRQIQCFSQIIKYKHEFESLKLKWVKQVKQIQIEGQKIQSGNVSFLSKIKKTNKQQLIVQNKGQLLKAKEQQSIYTELTKIISNILCYQQIDRFKSLRRKAYYNLLKSFAQAQKQSARIQRQLWLQVGRHDLILIDDPHNQLKPNKPSLQQLQGNLDTIGEQQQVGQDDKQQIQ